MEQFRLTPLVEVINLSKSYGDKKILEGISFKVYPGEIFAIVGKTGVGKTTLLHCILGILNYQGEVHLNGSYSFSPQRPAFYPELTLKENLFHFGRIQKITNLEAKAKHLLKLVDLNDEENELAKNLSGGMAKRFDLACALINNPKIIFLDEPTSDLDIVTRNKIMKIIKVLAAQGRAIVLVSHEISELGCANKIAILHNKKFVALAEPKKLSPLEKTFEKLTCY